VRGVHANVHGLGVHAAVDGRGADAHHHDGITIGPVAVLKSVLLFVHNHPFVLHPRLALKTRTNLRDVHTTALVARRCEHTAVVECNLHGTPFVISVTRVDEVGWH
jgi:hypothetical protein